MLKKYLTEDEQKQLLNTLKQTAGDVARRDGALISLLINTGMRIGECLRLSVSDAAAAMKSGYIYLPKEYRKGRAAEKRDHEVLVTVTIKVALFELLALREGAALDEALIVSRKSGGQAMSVRAFEQRVAYWAKLAGLPDGVSPHWFRHTRGMNVYNNTTSFDRMGAVKAALGHSSIRSSEIYARLTRENVETAMREVDEKMNGKPRLRLADLRKMHEGRVSL